jgi:hypothetical protein
MQTRCELNKILEGHIYVILARNGSRFKEQHQSVTRFTILWQPGTGIGRHYQPGERLASPGEPLGNLVNISSAVADHQILA